MNGDYPQDDSDVKPVAGEFINHELQNCVDATDATVDYAEGLGL